MYCYYLRFEVWLFFLSFVKSHVLQGLFLPVATPEVIYQKVLPLRLPQFFSTCSKSIERALLSNLPRCTWLMPIFSANCCCVNPLFFTKFFNIIFYNFISHYNTSLNTRQLYQKGLYISNVIKSSLST